MNLLRDSNDLMDYCVCFRHEAERLEQEAKGRLERQKITDEAEAERARKDLLELQAQSAAVESTGQAKAEAQSRAEAARIEGEAAVQQAKLKAEAAKIEAVSIFLSCGTFSCHSNCFPWRKEIFLGKSL